MTVAIGGEPTVLAGRDKHEPPDAQVVTST